MNIIMCQTLCYIAYMFYSHSVFKNSKETVKIDITILHVRGLRFGMLNNSPKVIQLAGGLVRLIMLVWLTSVPGSWHCAGHDSGFLIILPKGEHDYHNLSSGQATAHTINPGCHLLQLISKPDFHKVEKNQKEKAIPINYIKFKFQ